MKIFNLAIASLVQTGLASYCVDTNQGAGDTTGDGCDWYTANDGHCGGHDTESFWSNMMCCSCGGGVTYDCLDTNGSIGDTTGDGCDWYTANDGHCAGHDTSDFSSESMCCSCGGGVDVCLDSNNAVGDSYGDGCDWYASTPGYCGVYDTDSFKAGSMCCACQDQAVNLVQLESNCADTNAGVGDIGGDQCDWYADNSGQCGWWNTPRFNSGDMCCGCGGGESSTSCVDDENIGDLFGDGCDWYAENEGYCGFFDFPLFNAAEMCCSCQTDYAMNLSATIVGANEIYSPIVADACNDNADGWTDIGGDGCSWYDSNPGQCGWWDNGVYFTAADACCGCGGGLYCVDSTTGTDLWGDGCDWYVGNESSCGVFDDPFDNFFANNDCCSCKSAYNLNLATEECWGNSCPQTLDFGAGVCNDNANGGTDITGDGCDWYVGNTDTCGWWDTSEFSANQDCCACQGGITCKDSNNGASDITFDGCDWYVGMEDWCGWYDTPDFDAKSMCCACQGATASLNLSDADCADTDFNIGDSWGDGCTWYADNAEYCGSYDTWEFVAAEFCCACDGGLSYSCLNSNEGAADWGGDDCSWYFLNPSGCGLYDDDDFNAVEMCCACAGGDDVCADSNDGAADWGGDSCDWYNDNTAWCGAFDDEDFVAGDMCCSCAADALNLQMVGENCYSYASDNGASDSYGDGCEWYANNSGLCGSYDDDDFSANDQCCECNGGIPLDTICMDGDFGFTDSTNDSCAWYSDFNGECSGMWNTNWFTAEDMCCGCGGGVDAQCVSDSSPYGDFGGDGCDWYVGNEEWCGVFDTEDFVSAACCACMPQLFSWDLAQNLKSDQVIAEENSNQFIIAFLAVVAIGAGLSYNYGKKSKAQEKKTTQKAYVKNNVTEKLI